MKKLILVVLILIALAFWYLWKGEEPVVEAPSGVNSYSEDEEYYVPPVDNCELEGFECKG